MLSGVSFGFCILDILFSLLPATSSSSCKFSHVLQCVSGKLDSKPVPFFQKLMSMLIIKLSLIVSVALTKFLPSKYPSPGYRGILRDPTIPFSSVMNVVVGQAAAGGAVALLTASGAVFAAAVGFAAVMGF